MAIKERFFEELQNAITRGFTLAAVSVAMSCGTPSLPTTDAGTNAGGGGGTQSTMPPRDVDGGTLAEVPAGSFFCEGDAGTAGPYYGSCCFNLHCYQPTTSTCSVTVSPHSGSPLTPPLPPGSGTCLCGSAIAGPFAQPDGGNTECCYVAGSIGCLGRPLREGHETIVAAVVARADWA